MNYLSSSVPKPGRHHKAFSAEWEMPTMAESGGMTHLADRIIAHYEKHATAWASDRQNSGWIDQIWHDRFIDSLSAGARVLDLGCGPGRPVAKHMHERGLHVTGVDSSPTMISLCQRHLPSHEWIVADM
jgi:2-polyprenyl-3-methyl-5-hydroxy-6-metoxy-1,4-benzoquinol methylase